MGEVSEMGEMNETALYLSIGILRNRHFLALMDDENDRNWH